MFPGVQKSVRETLTLPKNSHFGSWNIGGFPNLQRAIAGGSKPNGLRNSLYHWKGIET
jgi:hypothetical protein